MILKSIDIKKCFLIFSLLFCIFTIILKVLNLNFINNFLNVLFLITCVVLVTAWIFLIVRYKVNKRWLKNAVTAILILLFVMMLPYIILFNEVSGSAYYEETSPSGKNKVIIFESSFIDASYYAYPKFMGIFYKNQDNGYVSKHDFWGGAEIEVEWKSDNLAYVKIKIEGFSPNEGSNKNDIIIVSFDS